MTNRLETYAPPSVGILDPETTYSYDDDQMLLSEVRPDGIVIERTHDSGGRVDAIVTPDGMVDYEYNPPTVGSGAGAIASIRGPYGVDMNFVYDGPAVTTTTWSGNISGAVGWDLNNDFQVIRETVTGAIGSGVTTFGYDRDQVLVCASPTSCSPAAPDALRLTRDAATGMIAQVLVGGTTEDLVYNQFGELIRQTVRHGSESVVDIAYDVPGGERDDLGRVVRKTETIGSVTRDNHYIYDTGRRLTDVFVGSLPTEHYEYDANGNRVEAMFMGDSFIGVYDDQDRLLSYGAFDFGYSDAGELITKTNRETDATTTYRYDAFGNLVLVGLPDGTLIEYLIDGMGRRVGKKVNGSLVRQWLYRDRLKPVAELDGSGAIVSLFVYGSREGTPDYVQRGGATFRVIADQLGSPRYVVNVANADDVPFRADYTAFGQAVGTGFDWMPFGFAGGMFDPDTGLIRFGMRDYDPATGRWTAKDPIRFRGGDNLYAYVGNDPINLTDPFGLWNPLCDQDPDKCFNDCIDGLGGDISLQVLLWTVPFAPTPKFPWETAKTLGGGSRWTTWASRASSALGMNAKNWLRTAGKAAAIPAGVAFAAALGNFSTATALCSAECYL